VHALLCGVERKVTLQPSNLYRLVRAPTQDKAPALCRQNVLFASVDALISARRFLWGRSLEERRLKNDKIESDDILDQATEMNLFLDGGSALFRRAKQGCRRTLVSAV